MILRSYDTELMKEAVSLYLDWDHEGFDYQAWLDDRNNVMLTDGKNVGLACCEYPGVYTGHYFFKDGGRKAITLAETMLIMMFTDYGAKIMRGLTRPENRKAIWMNRHLGFKSQGVVDTVTGPHELFTLTKDDFYGRC